MPDANAEVVREPITLRASSRRRLEERLALRFPRALASFARAVWRLPPRSRLRRALLRRTMALSWEALNRHDFEVTFALYDPDTETIFPPKLVSVGWEPVYRGRETRIEVLAALVFRLPPASSIRRRGIALHEVFQTGRRACEQRGFGAS